MAEKYPLANGLWSNAANWNGGTKPTSDDVVHSNSFIVDIDEDVNVLELRTDAGTTAVGGGYFDVVSDNLTISCDFIWPIDDGFGIQVSSNSGTTTIIGDIYMPKGNSNNLNYGLALNGTCLLNLIGSVLNKDISGAQNAKNDSGILINVSGARLNIIGDVEGGRATSSFSVQNTGIYINDVDCIVNITGIVRGGPIAGIRNNSGIFVATSNNTINVVGDVIGGFNYSANGILINTGGNNVNITGTAKSNNSAASVYCPNNITDSFVTMFGDIVNDGSQMAILVNNLIIDNDTEMSWKLIDDTNNDMYLYSVGSGVLGQATESDVRKDVVYGPSSELTGELEPVNVDTAQLASNLLDEITTSSNPLAERLRNVSTIQTTGAQISSLKIS